MIIEEQLTMYRRLFLSLNQTRNCADHAKAFARKRDTENATVIRHVLGGLHRGFRTSSTSYCEHKNEVFPSNAQLKTGAKNDDDLKVESRNNVYLEEKNIVLHDNSHAHTDSNTMAKADELVQELEVKEVDSSTPQAKYIVLEEVKVIEEIVETKTMPEQFVELKTDDFRESLLQQEEIFMGERKIAPEKLEVVVKVNEVGSSTQTEYKSLVEKGDGKVEAEGQDVRIKDKKGIEPKREETVKSGKGSLLDLLVAMKVEVTSKRKFIPLRMHLSSEPPAKSQPAEMESTISMFQKATAESPAQSETLSPKLVAAATAAASTLPNKIQAQSELLKRLRQHELISEVQKKGDFKNICDLIADMKVGKRSNGRQYMRPADQIRFDEDRRGYTHDRGITAELGAEHRKNNIFLGKRLGIFSPSTIQDTPDTATDKPTLWDLDFAEQLAQSVNKFPRNGFEEMIQWTREGKLWKYPIDNEAGLEEEASVPFHEHVFLEKHLEGVFPRHGPVRHFMELVVTGLAKNPYLTVKQKKEHIAWFEDYFNQKEELLKEADVYLN